MSNDSDPPKPVAPKPPAPARKPPEFDERKLTFAELVPFALQLVPDELVAHARDGRAMVRANAALGLAVAGHPAYELVTLVRDSELSVGLATATAIQKLGVKVRPLVPQIVAALDGAQPEVVASIVGTLAELIGACDDELIAALDVPLALATKSVLAAAGTLGRRGIDFLGKAARHERSRIRVNAVAGIGFHGKADIEASLAYLTPIEAGDTVPDVRTAAKQAMLAVVAREKSVAVDALPKNIPDFEERKLSRSELAEYEAAIDVDAMIFALQDGRAHVKINAARSLGLLGDRAARAARALGLNLRDSVPAVRAEMATALGKLGAGALDAAADLVGALGDAEEDVHEAAFATVEQLGPAARDALIRGLDASAEPHGLRVGALVGKLPGGAELLTEAFKSPAVNVQVNAALGLGQLGTRVGVGLPALLGARTGGDARTREAVRRALDWINPKGDTGPQAVAIEGFEERFLALGELEKGKAAIEKVGVADLIAHLQDGRDVVRANAALALGLLGGAALPAALGLGVRLRDDAARVRLAAAQAIEKIGDACVVETANDLVGALRDSDDKIAAAVAATLRARRGRMVGALVRGLETDDPRHGARICDVIAALPDAAEILIDAFASPAVNVQVNAALGLGALGKDRVTPKGRKVLEGARTGGWERTREAVRRAIETLDGPRSAGPEIPAIDGFETRLLGVEAFEDPAKLDAAGLVAHLTDGRAVVRANSATALGTFGVSAAGAARPLAVLLRDDDSSVRIAAAGAVDKLGDDAVKEVAPFLVGALRGEAAVAKVVSGVLAARKARVLTALIKGLETDDEAHAARICELVIALPDASEILCDAIESPAENVQVNAALGLGMLGEKRAGAAGRKALETRRTGGFVRTREAVFRALGMWK